MKWLVVGFSTSTNTSGELLVCDFLCGQLRKQLAVGVALRGVVGIGGAGGMRLVREKGMGGRMGRTENQRSRV